MAEITETDAPVVDEKLATEAQEVQAPPVPEVVDGEVIISSNVINGLFAEKQAAAREAEQAAREAPAQKEPIQEEAVQEAEQPETAAEAPASREKTASVTDEKATPAPDEKDAPAKNGRGDKAVKADAPKRDAKKPEQTVKQGKEKPTAAKASKEKEKAPPVKTQAGKEKSPPDKAQADNAKTPPVKEKDTAEKPLEVPLENPFIKPSEKIGAQDKEVVADVVLSEIHPFHTFRAHPYKVKEDAKMDELVASIVANGVMLPGLVRPEKDGNGYELIAGHRRCLASHLAQRATMPVIIREMTDLEAVRAMKDSNKQRDEDLPSERAALLDLELEALKHQGVQDIKNIPPEHVGKRSNEIVAENNNMTVKQVQRYIRLTKLEPELLEMVDDKKIGFTSAVEISYITPKNQKYIAVAIEGQQSAPSLSQAQRMRELDQQKLLNPDVIDGIMLEEKKEVDKVIISTHELGQFFGKEITPREMKDTIMQLLGEWKDKQPELAQPKKDMEQEK